eukprot:364261-Chlamydomonas_euryale.AAC.10
MSSSLVDANVLSVLPALGACPVALRAAAERMALASALALALLPPLEFRSSCRSRSVESARIFSSPGSANRPMGSFVSQRPPVPRTAASAAAACARARAVMLADSAAIAAVAPAAMPSSCAPAAILAMSDRGNRRGSPAPGVTLASDSFSMTTGTG